MVTAVGQINQGYHSSLSAGHRLRLPPWLGKHPFLLPVFPLSQHFPNDFLSWPQVFQQSNVKSSRRFGKDGHGEEIGIQKSFSVPQVSSRLALPPSRAVCGDRTPVNRRLSMKVATYSHVERAAFSSSGKKKVRTRNKCFLSKNASN